MLGRCSAVLGERATIDGNLQIGTVWPAAGSQGAEEREWLRPRGVLSLPLSAGQRVPPAEISGAGDAALTGSRSP